jgi:hypothetical protein
MYDKLEDIDQRYNELQRKIVELLPVHPERSEGSTKAPRCSSP